MCYDLLRFFPCFGDLLEIERTALLGQKFSQHLVMLQGLSRCTPIRRTKGSPTDAKGVPRSCSERRGPTGVHLVVRNIRAPTGVHFECRPTLVGPEDYGGRPTLVGPDYGGRPAE